MNSEVLETFFYWINERHRIYLKKTAGYPWPWTEDPILQTYSFCNVFRELDTVTIAFKKLLHPYQDHKHFWFLYALARQINWPDTVAELLPVSGLPDEFNVPAVYANMKARHARGDKLYTGAYMISGGGQSRAAGTSTDKPTTTLVRCLTPLWNERHRFTGAFKTIQSTTEWLSNFFGFSGFMAYEVATDLRHTRYLNSAPDIMTWANAGPGAKRGLNRIHGRPLEKPMKNDQANEEMKELLSISEKYLASQVPPLEMRDIEHSLCEVDKYIRTKTGQGKPRSRYHYKGK